MRIGDQSNSNAGRRKPAQHVGYFVVELEMVARGPLVVDLARARIDARSTAAHVLDDVAGVPDEDLRVVELVLGSVE